MLIYLSLFIYFALMLFIGIFAYRTASSNISGYMLGGRQVSPKVTALSAGASDMSGWMLMGLPGAMYLTGLDSIYIGFGLLLGALINYLLVAPRLRIYTEEAGDALTIPQFFSHRFDHSLGLRIISALIIVIFFTLYTSAGLVSGGKFFASAFSLDYQLGLVVTASVVVCYTLLGGFLAVSLTDFVQGCIMFVALVLVPLIAFMSFDSAQQMMTAAEQTMPAFGSSFETLTVVGLISTMSWGLGYFGQPHIIVRFMAIRSVADIPTARNIGMSWMTVTLIGSLSTGLVGVAYVNQTDATLSDPETIFVFLSNLLFHPLISGFLLAAILAAIMSTISSQLLVSASSLSEDLYKSLTNKTLETKTVVNLGRGAVVLVAIAAGILAADPNSSVLNLVSIAWAGFGAAFGPLVLCSLLWRRMTVNAAYAGLLTGAITVMFWVYVPVLDNGEPLSSLMYEIVPGFVLSLLAIIVVGLLDNHPSSAMVNQHDKVTKRLAEELTKDKT